MSCYKITADVYTIPYKENEFVLYAPLNRFASVITSDFANILNEIKEHNSTDISEQTKRQIDYLIQKDIINGSKTTPPAPCFKSYLSPSKLTLFLTNQCNMSCLYCYSQKDDITMNWNTAKAAIDYYANIISEENRNTFFLEFHGGGEPFCAWDMMKKCIDYINSLLIHKNLRFEFSASTNGILNEKILEWIVKNLHCLSISFDGLPHVQDYHRPLSIPNKSYEYVATALRYLDKHNFPYVIRCAVSTCNEDLLEETVDYILKYFKPQKIFFDTINPEFLSEDKKLEEPDLNKFLKNITTIKNNHSHNGCIIEDSFADITKIKCNFCYVGTDNFAVTPDGYLTNCWEVYDNNHPFSNKFIIGHINQNNNIHVFWDKIETLRLLSVDKLDYCRNCFAKWHCGGECALRVFRKSHDELRGDKKCQLNRKNIFDSIINLLEFKS